MPNKAIKKLIYEFKTHRIILENYEAYNHIVERTLILKKGAYSPGGERISQVILMAKKNRGTTKIIIDFIKYKCYCEQTLYGKEYRGKSVTGWKTGIKNLRPKITINKNRRNK